MDQSTFEAWQEKDVEGLFLIAADKALTKRKQPRWPNASAPSSSRIFLIPAATRRPPGGRRS